VLLRQGKADEALTKADAYIAGKPRDPQMRFLRGVILTEQGKQAEATAAFTQLTQEFPELPEPYNNLAALYAAQSQFDKARAALEMAIKLNPDYATAHENLGDVYGALAASLWPCAATQSGNATVPPKLADPPDVQHTHGQRACGDAGHPQARAPVRHVQTAPRHLLVESDPRHFNPFRARRWSWARRWPSQELPAGRRTRRA
jgi:tetratricopeptide (TPR) repeat protein